MAYPRRSSSRSPRSRFTLGLLLLTAITLLVLDLPGTGPLRPVRNVIVGAFEPVRSAGDSLFSPIANGWKGAFGYDELKEENDRLRDELAEREGDEAEVARLQAEVEELKKIAGVKIEGVQTRTAQIVSGPINSFDRTVEIDQGSGDGVKKGQAVVTSGNAVLGRIDEVRGGRSRVELITEPSFEIGIRLEDGTLGVISGQGKDRPLVVDAVDANVKEGDFVYTSGIDESAFPKDLKVGEVSKVGQSTSGASRTLEVEPLADLSSVYVKVVLRDPPR